MKAVAPAILYALFVWWFTTGLVLLLAMRRKSTINVSLVGAALLVPFSLYLLALSSTSSSLVGVYVAFTSAILLWGAQEIAFLTGTVTGPRPYPCPPEANGVGRFRAALGAILYHEIALVVSAVATLAATWHGSNQTGALTFLVLWVMRISAEINLFLGVPVLNDELMPPAISYLRSYFRRGPVNGFFPLALIGSVAALGIVIVTIAHPLVGMADKAGYALVAALLGLAILEHAFMLVPLPVDRLWRWATGAVARRVPPRPTGRRQVAKPLPDVPPGGSEIERVAITSL